MPSIKDAIRWLQGRLGFINDLPSWANELLSRLLCAGVVLGLVVLLAWLLSLAGVDADLRAVTFPLAFVLSEVYEHFFDPWGYNAQDVVERVRGIGFALAVVILWHPAWLRALL